MSVIVSSNKTSVLVILRREYLEITGNFCAAKLIEYFRHWTKWKLKNHRTPWVYQPLKKIYADLMGEHSLHVIRSAIALLEEMGIIEKQKNPGNGQDRTWQYKLHHDVLNQLLEHRKGKTESSKFTVESHLRSDPETSKPQQHAVEEKKHENVEEEVLSPQPDICDYAQESVRQAAQPQQTQITHLADELEQDDSTDEIDPDEDIFSAPEVKVDSSMDKPSKREIAEICTELRRLRINPEPCLGVVKKYWGNVAGAIARVKEAIHEEWCDNPTGLFINSCKSGAKAKNTVTSDVSAWFEWARKQRIVLAMSGGVVYTSDGDAVEVGEMMQRFPVVE
ncbi:ArsR family transcriptional regulator [Tolypothrix sp. FACHB-123]|uniref:ArsR family transcriptional regulator n=1 Tax=Tolypothrix sp. FACHB-123 TaxID=2692868 RepID=UPI001683769D|nr:ArsR family transcriptional regulator [Tolypothrix sp. FACHB-123]MBD2357277.1 ArsR family transcriptional regulator [Tolypothrix sp. FACHB-123]